MSWTFLLPLGAAFKPDMISLKARLGVEGFGYTTPSLRLPSLSVKTLSLELENGTLRAQGRAHLAPDDDHAFDLTMTMPGGKTRLDCTITSRLTPASVSALLDGLADERVRTHGCDAGGQYHASKPLFILMTACGLLPILMQPMQPTVLPVSLASRAGSLIRSGWSMFTERRPAEMPFVFQLGDSLNTKGPFAVCRRCCG